MHDFFASLASFVLLSHTGKEALALWLRWIHFVAGILWVGLLYFFNLINIPFMKQVDAVMKPKILQYMTLPALNWFRWSSIVAVFVGFWYWGEMFVGPDAQRMGVSPLSTIGFFLLVWIVAWALMNFAIMKTPSGYVVGAVVTVVCIAAGWLFVNYTPVGQDDNHVLCIGVGGGFGIVMLMNVWGIIWRNNKKIIRGTLAGAPPANAAVLARQAFLASRTNFFLSIPLLFFMAASSHYTILGK
ncbi:MAG TPA: urate hydroxylase PuuD [Candidatus Aquilonibacter sp.]|nr:urate hydroxylase PuuD [Candidatus Aquilonibacter sp.]